MLTPDDLERVRPIVDRAVEAMAGNLSDLRSEIVQRLDAIGRRDELTAETIRTLGQRIAAVVRWTGQPAAMLPA